MKDESDLKRTIMGWEGGRSQEILGMLRSALNIGYCMLLLLSVVLLVLLLFANAALSLVLVHIHKYFRACVFFFF